MKKPIFLLILLMNLFGVASSQRSSVSATVDKETILIGEQLQLYLKAVLPKNKVVNWFTLDTFSHFEILQQSKIDSQQTTEGLFLQQIITLTSWDSGRWAIPSFNMANLKTKPIVVNVSFSPMDPNQPYHDIKDILEVEKPLQSNWYWYLLGLAVLIALFLLFFPPRQEKSVEPVAVQPEDPFKVAMRRLDQLDTRGEAKPLYTELTDTFRNYLEQRKGIQSLSKTTDDLSVQIRQLQLPQEEYTHVVQTLRLSDMVKFAKYLPQATENEKAIDVIKKNIIAIENLK